MNGKGRVVQPNDLEVQMMLAQQQENMARQQANAMGDRHMLIAQGLFVRWSSPNDAEETVNDHIEKATNAATLFLARYGIDVRCKPLEPKANLGAEPDGRYTGQD